MACFEQLYEQVLALRQHVAGGEVSQTPILNPHASGLFCLAGVRGVGKGEREQNLLVLVGHYNFPCKCCL